MYRQLHRKLPGAWTKHTAHSGRAILSDGANHITHRGDLDRVRQTRQHGIDVRTRHGERGWSEIQEGMPERQRQCEGDGRRQAVVNLARHPQHSCHGHRRDRHDDQLGRRLQPDQLGQRDDEQVDAEIADGKPAEMIPLLKRRAAVAVQRHLVAAHMPAQVDQRRDVRPQQGHERQQDHRDDERPAFPPRPRRPFRKRGQRGFVRNQFRRVDHRPSRRPKSRSRSALSLMNPSASRWS